MLIGVFPGKWSFWYVCFLMIVSIDTSMCGKQIVLFFGQETFVVVETSKILLLFIYYYYFLKGLLLLKKHFETGMLMLPKTFIYFAILQYIQ